LTHEPFEDREIDAKGQDRGWAAPKESADVEVGGEEAQ
jgi:hypothetical protein